MSDTIVAIVAAEAKMASEKEDGVENKLRAAMSAVQNHWLVLDEETQFQGAILAVMQLSDEETRERIKAELADLKILNAMLSGVPVDPNWRVSENPIGLAKFWAEARKT